MLLHRRRQYITAWLMHEKGILPYAGGFAEQPYYWIEAIELIGAQVAAVALARLREREQGSN